MEHGLGVENDRVISLREEESVWGGVNWTTASSFLERCSRGIWTWRKRDSLGKIMGLGVTIR